jgi:hypothetical protein
MLQGFDVSADTTAILTNFTGDFGTASFSQGAIAGDIVSGVLLGTTDVASIFAQSVNLGGRFGFDLRFDVGPVGERVGFSVGLYSDELGQYLGEFGTVAAFELAPGQPDLVFVESGLGAVSAVPEPATLASLVFGLALMGSALRARRKG